MNSLMSFFFNDTATTEIYTLSLHDALPISDILFANGAEILALYETEDFAEAERRAAAEVSLAALTRSERGRDRKSTRLNSSHANISYAVFCLKKNKSLLCVTCADITRVTDI